LAQILGDHIWCGLFALCTSALAETFDIFEFTPPAKWKRADRDGVIVYTRPKDKFCEISIYKAQPTTYTPAAIFAAIWAASVEKTSGVTVEGEHKDVGHGWTLSYGHAQVANPPVVSLLYVLSGSGVAGVIIANITNTKKCQNDVVKFADSLGLSDFAATIAPPETNAQAAAPKAAPPPPPPAAAAPAGAAGTGSAAAGTTTPTAAGAPTGSNPVLGVWWLLGFDRQLNTITNASGTNFSHFSFTSRAKVYRMAFFADGTYTGSLPDTGLMDLREHRQRFPEDWGSYSVKGNSVHLTNAKGNKWQATLRDGKLYISDDDYYLKTPNPQGARFKGTFAARHEPNLTITLGADGRFVDRGAIAWALNEPNRNRFAGSGKYDVSFYTMNFSYDDGRRMSVSLLSEGDPNTSSVRLGTGIPLERVQ
jgi:hypothetical protein